METVDNSSAGFNNGEVTYRLYAELNGGLITFIFADESNPLEISTSSTFVDDQFGSDIQGLINQAVIIELQRSASNIADIASGGNTLGFIDTCLAHVWEFLGQCWDSLGTCGGHV